MRFILLLTLFAPAAAFAQGEAHPLSVDLSPITTPLIVIVGSILSALATAISGQVVAWLFKKMQIQNQQVELNIQAKIDSEAQKALAGAISRAQADTQNLTIPVKNQLIADAASRLVTNAGAQLATISKNMDIGTKAAEVIENRIGLMIASAQGTPVPNPSAPAPVSVAPVAGPGEAGPRGPKG